MNSQGKGRRPRIRDVAEQAGVAMSSVSRVLTGHPDVSPVMREAVMAAVEDLGYAPDPMAQGLRSRRTMSIGFTVSEISNPTLASAVTGAEHRLREAGYSMLLTNSEGDPNLDAANIELLSRRRVDGLILCLTEEQHPATRAVLDELEIPIVLLDRDPPEGMVVSRACFDHRPGMAAATRHLIELGHRRIALIVGGNYRPARERRLGVEEAVNTAKAEGIAVELSVHHGPFSIGHGERATSAVLRQSSQPTALIAGGNLLMHGSLRVLRDRGVMVGRDLSVVGCDDVAVSELHTPQIAVVRRDMNALGLAAADLLVKVLGGFEGTTELTLPTEFVPRASCAPPAESAQAAPFA